MDKTAKIFTNGRSQAVRLPAEYRFDTKEVFISRDAATGNVILSSKPSDWNGFFQTLEADAVPADFMDADDRKQAPQERDPLEGILP